MQACARLGYLWNISRSEAQSLTQWKADRCWLIASNSKDLTRLSAPIVPNVDKLHTSFEFIDVTLDNEFEWEDLDEHKLEWLCITHPNNVSTLVT